MPSMALCAEFPLKLDLPYSEYWLPLLMGMGAGVLALAAGRLIFRKAPPPPPPAPVPKEDYDPFTQGSPSEQRKGYRRGGNPTQVFFALPGQKVNPQRGWVLDRSSGGLCLLVDQEIHQGTLMAVLPVNAPALTPWVDIDVRSCKKGPDGFTLGCQFIKTPTWSILLLFG